MEYEAWSYLKEALSAFYCSPLLVWGFLILRRSSELKTCSRVTGLFKTSWMGKPSLIRFRRLFSRLDNYSSVFSCGASKKLVIVLMNVRVSIGLGMYPSQPAALAFCSSPFMA